MHFNLTTTFALCAFLVAPCGRVLTAQDTSVPGEPVSISLLQESPSAGRPLAGAILGAAAGTVLGGLAGITIGGSRCRDDANPDSCQWLPGMLIGATVGLTLGTPIGAHLLNRRRGSLPYSLLASAAIGALGTALILDIEDRPHSRARNAQFFTVAIGVPVLQILTSTLIETRTSRR